MESGVWVLLPAFALCEGLGCRGVSKSRVLIGGREMRNEVAVQLSFPTGAKSRIFPPRLKCVPKAWPLRN